VAALRDVIAGQSRRRLAVLAGVALAVVAAIAVALLLLSGEEEDPARAIDRAFQQPIESAHVNLDADLRVDGSPAVPVPIALRVAGPYRSGGGRTIPVFDLAVALTGAGRNVAGRLLSTGDNAFVLVQGIPYEIGRAEVAKANRRLAAGQAGPRPPSLRQLGIEPLNWLVQPEDLGEEEIAGAETRHYGAKVDVVRLLDDLNRAAGLAAQQIGRPPPPRLSPPQREQLRRIAREVTLDVFVGEEDGRIRRLAARAPFAVPPEGRAQAGGATGGVLTLSLQFSEVGRPVRVVPPPDPRPIEDLRRQIGPLGAAPGAGGR
jgi:hypothetical protein